MKKIYKWHIENEFDKVIEAPIEEFLDVQIQNDMITVWAIVDLAMETKEWYLYTVGTGWDMEEFKGIYIGTVQLDGLVWHVFATPIHQSVDMAWANPEEVSWFC